MLVQLWGEFIERHDQRQPAVAAPDANDRARRWQDSLSPKVRMLPNSPARKGFLAPDSFDKLIAELPANLKPLVTFLYHSGVRLGEAKQIEWSQVQWSDGNNDALIVLADEQTKNGEPRISPLTDPELLRMLHESRKTDGLVFDDQPREPPLPTTYFPHTTSDSPLFSITARNFTPARSAGAAEDHGPSNIKCRKHRILGSQSSLNMLRPSESRQTISPSITAFCAFNLARILSEFLETFVDVSLTRDEFAVSIPDVRECAEAVVLEFEQESGSLNGTRARVS